MQALEAALEENFLNENKLYELDLTLDFEPIEKIKPETRALSRGPLNDQRFSKA